MKLPHYDMIGERRMKGGRALMNSQSSTPQLYRQIRRILMVSISVTIILALGVSLWLSLRQDARMRDQTLLSGAQTVASAPELVGSQDPNVRMDYIERMVKNVPYIDIFAVYDPDGIPITFYDLATGTSDPADVPPLSQEILGHFEAGNDTLLYNYEAPEGAPLRLRHGLCRRWEPDRVCYGRDLYALHPQHGGRHAAVAYPGRHRRDADRQPAQPAADAAH